MADIRYTTGVVDDFNRPNENPVLPPWHTDIGAGMKIKGNQFYGTVFPTAASISYYGPLSITGTQMECWGRIGFSGAAIGDGWRLGLCLAGSDFMGYECNFFNSVGPDVWVIRRYNPGAGAFTNLASVNASLPSINDLVLMQIDDGGVPTIKCYRSTDNGANWTLIVSVSEGTYRTNLHPFLGMTGVDTAWNDFGGGIPRERRHMPQFYRWIDAPRKVTTPP